MRRRAMPISWLRRDPQHYRFAMPNSVWEYKLKPIEFMIFSYRCYCNSTSTLTPEAIATGVHLTTGTVKKYLAALVAKELIGEDGTPILKCKNKNFFTLPNEVFLLRLPLSAFMVYAYLLLIEDRRTHICHPSYNTIAAATGLAKNTAMKSINTLLETGLITVESSSYFDKHGMKWKGNNLYTILPVRPAADAFHQRQLQWLELEAKHGRVLQRQKEYDRRHSRDALCARSPLRQHLTRPNGANRCAALERHKARDEEKQDKSVASYAAPPSTSARSAGSLRGTG